MPFLPLKISLFGGASVAPEFDANNITGAESWLRMTDVTLNSTTISAITNKITGKAAGPVQGTATAQPTYVASSSLNSQPAASFDGSSDWMQMASDFSPLVDQPGTVFVVIRTGALGAIRRFLDGSASGNRWALQINSSGSVSVILGTITKTTTEQLAANTNYILSFLVNGNSTVFKINNVTATLSAATYLTTAKLTRITLGASYVPGSFFNGHIAELLAFNSTFSGESTVYSYLSSRYAIT